MGGGFHASLWVRLTGGLRVGLEGREHTPPHPAPTPGLAFQQADPLLNHRGSLRCEDQTTWTEKGKFTTTPGDKVYCIV